MRWFLSKDGLQNSELPNSEKSEFDKLRVFDVRSRLQSFLESHLVTLVHGWNADNVILHGNKCGLKTLTVTLLHD